jgi:hypothetical protein
MGVRQVEVATHPGCGLERHAPRPYARTVRRSDAERLAQGTQGPAAEQAQGSAPALAEQLGNRGFTQALARMADGEGILADGTVHPEVAATIAAHRGRGSAIPAPIAERAEQALGAPVDDVRIHTDATANALARAVSARAFAVGRDVYFAQGEYRPGTPSGDGLLAHELAHTEQQRSAPAGGPLVVSQPGDALERDADVIARDLLA